MPNVIAIPPATRAAIETALARLHDQHKRMLAVINCARYAVHEDRPEGMEELDRVVHAARLLAVEVERLEGMYTRSGQTLCGEL